MALSRSAARGGKPGVLLFQPLDGALGTFTFSDSWIDGRGPYDIAVDIALVDNVLACVGLAVRSINRDGRVDPTLLRAITENEFIRPALRALEATGLPALIAESIENEARPAGLYDGLDEEGRRWYYKQWPAKEAREHAKQWRRLVSKASQAGGDELLQAVALVYLRAENRGEPPTKAVEKAFKVPATTAISYVRRARSARMIPPASRGRTRARPTQKRG